MTLSLIILRTARPKAVLAFYQHLGLQFVEEQHGDGPLHYAACRDGLTLEIYPSRSALHGFCGGDTALGFDRTGLEALVQSLEQAGGQVIEAPHPWTGGRLALIRDPDGRPVYLFEKP